MSLDIRLFVDTPIKRRSTRIFVRDNGATRELPLDEAKARWPDTDIQEMEYETNEAWSGNITHNLAKMAKEAGLYNVIWAPDKFHISKAADIIPDIEKGLAELKKRPKFYKQYAPENNWGTYGQLVSFTKEYLTACKKYPEARIRVSR